MEADLWNKVDLVLVGGSISSIDGWIQKQPSKVFSKEGVLKNFTKFTGKSCIRGSFLIKLQASANLIVNFAKHLWATASADCVAICNPARGDETD